MIISTLFYRTGTSFNEGVSFQQNIKGTAVFASVNRSDDASITPRSKTKQDEYYLACHHFLG